MSTEKAEWPPSFVLRSLYALVLLPTVTEWLESGQLPSKPRDLITDLVLTAVVLVLVIVILRELARTAHETQLRVSAVEQLRHAERLSTVGRLAAGLAHELGTPLNVVGGRAKMLIAGDMFADEVKDAGRIILETAQRMTQLVRELLDFARKRPANPARMALADAAGHVKQLLEPMAKKKQVALSVAPSEESFVVADVFQVQQALTNMAVNAIQAVDAGGQVTIFFGSTTASPPLEVAPGSRAFAAIGVRDDGPGITDADRPQLFDPFFTTKSVGEGTGLGLAVAHGLVRENGGWITVESKPGEGACFTIMLPRAKVGQAS